MMPKGSAKGGSREVATLHFRSHFRLKIDEKNDVEIDAEKVMKMDENRCENGAAFDRKFDDFRKVASRKTTRSLKRCKHANHYIHAVE